MPVYPCEHSAGTGSSARGPRMQVSDCCLILVVVMLAIGAARPGLALPDVDDETQPVVGSITLLGNEKTDAAVIRRELGFAEGDPFPLEQLDDIWDHLEDIGYFAFVDIEYEESEPGLIDVTIVVEEDNTFNYTPLIEYDRRHKYLLGVQLEQINFRGKGETVGLKATWYRLHGYEAGWRRPWFLNKRGLELTVSGGWQQAGFVYRPTDYTQWQVGTKLAWNVASRFIALAGASYGGFEQQETFSERAVDRGDGAEGLVVWSAEWRNRLVLTAELAWDSRDFDYYPTRGGFHSFRLQRVEGRGFAGYTEMRGDLRQFLPTPWQHILALRAWGRLVDGPLPIEDRLYWGGPENLRGFDYASFEGEEAYILTAEYRWPMFLMPISPDGRVIGIGTHVFIDAGDVWYDGADPGGVRWSWGGGLHLNVSAMQFRFELAKSEEGDTVFQFEDRFNF